jgi:hypothetical protein
MRVIKLNGGGLGAAKASNQPWERGIRRFVYCIRILIVKFSELPMAWDHPLSENATRSGFAPHWSGVVDLNARRPPGLDIYAQVASALCRTKRGVNDKQVAIGLFRSRND